METEQIILKEDSNETEIIAFILKQLHGKSISSETKKTVVLFKKNRNIMLHLITKHGFLLQFASNELKHDREIIIAAISQNPKAFQYVPQILRGDKEIGLVLVKRAGQFIYMLDAVLKEDKEVALCALKQNASVVNIGKELRKEIGTNNPIIYLERYFKLIALEEKLQNNMKIKREYKKVKI